MLVEAEDTPPTSIPGYLSSMSLSTGIVNQLTSALGGNTVGANANIVSFAFSLSGALGAALGGSVVTNNIQDTTEAYLTGASGSPTVISQAGSVTVEAVSNEAAAGAALGVNIGSVAAGVSVVASTIGGLTTAYVDNYVNIGQAAGQSVGSLTVEATAGATIVSTVGGLSGGIGAFTYNEADSTANPTVEAYTGNDPITLTGDMVVSASATPSVDSNVFGVAVGLLAAGGSVANATASPTRPPLRGARSRRPT